MSASARRISVGFQGGQVLALRVTDKELKDLYDALGDGGWHEVQTEDGPVRVYVGQVVYISAESDELRVGFG
jgi:hypothetical protein